MDKVITVVIPTFNRAEVTDRAIDSVTSKHPDLIEIIVIDDCSNPPYRAKSLKNSCGIRIEVHRTPYNGGPGTARALAVDKANCGIIAFLDSDDRFTTDWIDRALDEVLGADSFYKDSTVIAGKARNGTRMNRICVDILGRVPKQFRIASTRFATVMFNPFYTSSTMLSKHLCTFDDSLRYCEDYHTNAMAIFAAKRIVIYSGFGATISRRPGSSGGLSGMQRNMFLGEMKVRRSMLTSSNVPLIYKLFVPIGMAYQLTRTLVKIIVR